MGLSFNLTIFLCLFLHSTSSAQDETNEQLTIEMKQMKDNMSYLMSAVEKLQIKVRNKKTIQLKVEKQISELNERIERALNMSKINSDEIDSIRQCLNISIKGCGEEDNTTHPIGPTQPVINQGQCNISELSQLYHLSPDTLVYTWKNLNVSNTVQKKEKVMESDIFPLDKHGINAQLKIEIDSDGDFYSSLRFLRKQPSDTWAVKVHPRVTYVMKVENKVKIIDTFIRTHGTIAFGNSLKYDKYDYRNSFYYFNDKPEPKYEVGETFSIEVHVETPEMINQFYSDNGTVKGNICPCEKIMEWVSTKQIEWTPILYFYTSPQGYRALIHFYFDNKADTKWLNVYIHISPGLHDSSLKTPKWKGTFTLINQIDPNKSVTRVVEGIISYYFYFAMPSKVSEFVVNDELKYEASIEIIN